MSDFGRRFDASELGDDVVDNAAAAELLAVARDLETYARSDSVTLSGDFEDRVMAAIANEPPPRPMGSRGLLGIVAVVRDSWRLVWSADRPMAVRAQALAFVLLAAVALGSLGSLAAVGVGALLSPNGPAPTVQPAPVPTPSPSALPSPSPTPVRQPVAERHAIGVTDGDGRADRDRRADRDARRDRRFLRPGIRIGFGERLVRARLRRRDGATDQRLVRARVGW